MEQELYEFLSAQDYEGAVALIEKYTAEEIAGVIEKMDKDDLVPFCRVMDSDTLAQIMVLLPSEIVEEIINGLHDYKLAEVFEEVSVDDTVEIIEEMPEEIVRRIAEDDEIVILLKERNFAVLKPLLASMNATDVALVFDRISDAEIPVLFRILPKDLAAETFVEMESDVTEKLISKLNDRELKAVMDELFLDDTVDLLEEMPANVVKRMLAQSDKETRAHINDILKYPKDSAGSIMTIEYVSLHPFLTVEQAFARIRKTAIDSETIYTCYVKDAENKLLGLVTAKDLMLAPADALISDIMHENVIYAYTEDDKEDVAHKISEYGFLALPIVDRETRLVGIVTVDDAIDVIVEENTEDIAKMSAVLPSDKPYLKTSVWRICFNRLPWLLLLMVSATFTGLIITANETTLNMDVYGIILTACMPMLMGTGGNAGSQASAMVIRSIALKEIEFKDFLRVVWKEIRVSVLLGAILSVACFAKLMLIDGLINVDNGVGVALVICVSMFATVLIAKLIGAILPLVAKLCRLDPAVVASPFITTIVDILSITIYCAFAVTMLAGV